MLFGIGWKVWKYRKEKKEKERERQTGVELRGSLLGIQKTWLMDIFAVI
jgi:hypothetical protein